MMLGTILRNYFISVGGLSLYLIHLKAGVTLVLGGSIRRAMQYAFMACKAVGCTYNIM